jgi:hypothetical protein
MERIFETGYRGKPRTATMQSRAQSKRSMKAASDFRLDSSSTG